MCRYGLCQFQAHENSRLSNRRADEEADALTLRGALRAQLISARLGGFLPGAVFVKKLVFSRACNRTKEL